MQQSDRCWGILGGSIELAAAEYFMILERAFDISPPDDCDRDRLHMTGWKGVELVMRRVLERQDECQVLVRESRDRHEDVATSVTLWRCSLCLQSAFCGVFFLCLPFSSLILHPSSSTFAFPFGPLMDSPSSRLSLFSVLCPSVSFLPCRLDPFLACAPSKPESP